MYRLAELSDSKRKSLGSMLLLLGILGLSLGVVWIHWAQLSETELVNGVEVPVVVDYLNWFPRGTLMKGLGYLIVLGTTTMALIGASFLWLLNQKMTWARATVAAMLAWIALLFFFGIVPSEWLNFAQTDLEWGNDPALVIPAPLVLGNTVELSYSAIKDAISGGYHIVLLVAAPLFALQLQKMKDGRPASAQPVEQKSPYGRPLVKGDG